MVGPWIFAGFLNWTVNARSVLPLIPAAGILMFRRLESIPSLFAPRRSAAALAVGLAISALLSFWITSSDVAWANSQREAANLLYQKTRSERGGVFLAGHWGFQYYMQAAGFTLGDEENSNFREGDLVVIPENNTELIKRLAQFRFVAQQNLELLRGNLAATMASTLDAGFHSSYWGPLPFAFGKVPLGVYHIGRLAPLERQDTATHQGNPD